MRAAQAVGGNWQKLLSMLFLLPESQRTEAGVPIRNVVLTAHQESLVKALVEARRYENASEVLHEGLRLVEAREERAAARLQALRDAARIGIADLDEGRHREFDSVDDLAAYLRDLPGQAASGTQPNHGGW